MVRAFAGALLAALIAAVAVSATPTRSGTPVPMTRPSVDGVAEVGVQLSARPGWWKGVRPLRLAYRWERCARPAAGCATIGRGRVYTVQAEDVGAVLRVAVRARNRRGTRTATSKPTAQIVPVPTVDAAGDIACDPTSSLFHGGNGTTTNCRERATSDLLVADNPTAVLTLGDDQYECGRASAFASSYDPSWGRLKAITHPAIGNHEYGRKCHEDDPSPYFDYFGSAAGTRYQGWYSYELGTWHMIALNSECTYGEKSLAVGGCQTGSPEETWLRHDLAAHPSRCTLAYWHEPRFSSGEHGDQQAMSAIWNDLANAHADIVLSGHNHDYERFDPIGAAPQSSDMFQNPIPNPTGIREFVVGTGGRNTYPFKGRPPLAGEVVREDKTFGVLHLSLGVGTYTWKFEPVAGETFTDAGSGTCN